MMQADEVARPFHRDGWIYEEKYDGWRMVAYKDGTGGATRQPCWQRTQPTLRGTGGGDPSFAAGHADPRWRGGNLR